MEDTSAIAADAYIWGLPLVITMRTMQTLALTIGVNHLFPQRQLAGPASRDVVAPNVDTLYDLAVLDLRGGPLVLTVPEIHDRYYTLQFLAMNTETFAHIGTRVTGGAAGSWVIASPGWNGVLPPAAHLISAPTPLVFVLGRFLVLSADDLPTARAVMSQVVLEPLTPKSTETASAPSSLGTPLGRPQDVANAGASFFDELGDVLAISPVTSAEDRAAQARFAAIGIAAAQHPAADGTPDFRADLARGVNEGAARVAEEMASAAESANAWNNPRRLGQYGDDFLLRAVIAQVGWGAEVPEEAIYITSIQDANGAAYSGTRNYLLHFPAGGLPPARAFWSLTLYGTDAFLVENSAKRYAIRDRTPGLQTNSDGSLDIYLQHSPPLGHESNWLPTPIEQFVLNVRFFLPEPAVFAGTYRLPAVTPN